MSGNPRMDFSGRRGVIFGAVNKNSLAWDAAAYLRQYGAEVVLVCRREKTVPRLKALGADIGIKDVYFCDVEEPEEMDACFDELHKHAPFDFMLHSIAWSNPKQLQGCFIEMTRDNFLRTMEVSAYSFVDIARRMVPLMPEGGSMAALSFEGAEHPYPGYNAMGVAKAALEASVRGLALDLGEKRFRVNAIRTSPKQTLSARGISSADLIGLWAQTRSMREGRATREQIARFVAFVLVVDCGLTGQVINCDNGTSVNGMFHPERAYLLGHLTHATIDYVEGRRPVVPVGIFDRDE